MQQNDLIRVDFLQSVDLRLKESKVFFEPNLPLLDHFFSSPFFDEAETLFALDEMIYYFKAQIKTQQNVFCFIPVLPPSFRARCPRYFALLSEMTHEAVDLLRDKLRDCITQNTTPQALRDFYELWLECLDVIYQKYAREAVTLAAFAEIMNSRFQ